MQGEYKLGASGSEAKVSVCDCELEMGEEQICRETRTASGALKRDVIAVKRTWTFRYSWLPGKARNTGDAGMGRDELRALFAVTIGSPSTALSFHVPTEDAATEDVTVQFVAGSWREKLLWRESAWGTIYEVGFGLVEV